MKPDVTPIAVLTRPAGRNGGLAARLRAVGWRVHEWPALCIEPLSGTPRDMPLPRDFDLAVFVSGNAATHYLDQLKALGVDRWPASCVTAAVGPATAARLRDSGRLDPGCAIVHPPIEAPRHDSEALWELLVARGPIPRRVLLVRGTEGRDWLTERLREHGSTVCPHAVYRRTPARWDADVLAELKRWADAGQHPAWLMTSGESIEAARANVALAVPEGWWDGCRFVITHSRLVSRLGISAERAGQAVRLSVSAEDALFNAFVSG